MSTRPGFPALGFPRTSGAGRHVGRMLSRLMLDRSDWELLARVPVFWPDLEDAWLHAILTIDTHWKAKHRGHAWQLDRWGEGPSLLTFADLGLELRAR